jgi:hypothetical protein
MKGIVDFVNLGHEKAKNGKAKYRTVERGNIGRGKPCWDQLRITQRVKSKSGKKIKNKRK